VVLLSAAAAAQAPAVSASPAQALEDRKALTGILFVLKTGHPLGTSHRNGLRLRHDLLAPTAAWQQAGRLVPTVPALARPLDEADKIDWARAAVDSTSARAFAGVEDRGGQTPRSPGRPGVKQHVLVDARASRWRGEVTAANVPEIKELVPLVDSCGPLG